MWAAGSGVTNGVSETSFAPGRTCTDWEVLTFIWRALGTPGQRTDFAGYEDAAAWAEGMGLLQDTDTQPPCLRRDAVTFLLYVSLKTRQFLQFVLLQNANVLSLVYNAFINYTKIIHTFPERSAIMCLL